MKQNYIGENIRIYRERANLTQQQLADKVGVSWEMISRYERYESSPLNKIDPLSNALNISKTQLLERHIPTSYKKMEYKVPLFVHIPTSYKFESNQTNYFYSCPEWIIQRDFLSIALDTSLIDSDISDSLKKGVLYISIHLLPQKGDLIVVKDTTQLILKRYDGNRRTNILGKVLAQEVRY